jgi:hypothetical protein
MSEASESAALAHVETVAARCRLDAVMWEERQWTSEADAGSENPRVYRAALGWWANQDSQAET